MDTKESGLQRYQIIGYETTMRCVRCVSVSEVHPLTEAAFQVTSFIHYALTLQYDTQLCSIIYIICATT